MRDKTITTIVNVLVTGEKILECYKDNGCPTIGARYKAFMFEVTGILLNVDDHDFEGYMSWLYSNYGNDLPKTSSGSLYTALGDADNMLLGCGDDLTDEEHEFFDTLYRALFINKK